MVDQYIVRINQLALNYEDGTSFEFNDINIRKGIITGIIGANGSGKTTFIEAMLDLKNPTKSDVWIDDIAQKKYFSTPTHRTELGCQLQVFAFSETIKVGEMVTLHKHLYQNQSQRVYDDLAIGEISAKRLDKLSGGQKQRINLYMALAHTPKLITLDEPSSALDKSMAEKLIKLLTYLTTAHNCSIIMITHHPYELDICEEIIAIHNGTNSYHETRDDFINTIIGKYHAQIYIGKDNATAIETEIQTMGGVKKHFNQMGQIDIFGSAEMEGDFLKLVKTHNLKSYSFGQTNSADILKITTSFAE